MANQKKSPAVASAKGIENVFIVNGSNIYIPAQDPVVLFVDALHEVGLVTKDTILADGRLYRFHVEGDRPGSKNGWYVLYGDGLPAGAFGCWKRGVAQNWCAKAKTSMTSAERRAFRSRMKEVRKAHEIENTPRRKEAAEKAAAIWGDAPSAPADHPYLVKKNVRCHGLRLHKEALVVPLYDNTGTIHSLQFIDIEGNKRFLSGGHVTGCFFLIGEPTDKLCIAEGYATAASIHEATGYAVAVAFNCGNLLSVAQVFRKKFPSIELMLCADNDTKTEGNPGLTKAREAAFAVGALLAVPPCHGDFNDILNGGVR